MKKNIVPVFGLLFIISAFLFFQNRHKNVPILQNNITLAGTPVPTGTGDFSNTNTWKRYAYFQRFTIAYPPQWNVTVSNDLSTVTFMTAGFHQDDDFSMPYGNSSEVTYAIFGEHDMSDMTFKNGDQFTDDNTSETMVIINIKHLQIDGLPAVEFDYYPTDNTHFLRTRIAIRNNRLMYRFDATYASDLGKQLFEKMIHTLKFVKA